MPDISVNLTESEMETPSRCAKRRNIDSVSAYTETLLTQFVAFEESRGSDREVDEEIESKLEDLGYL